MKLFGEMVVSCFDFLLVCEFVKTKDGCVIAEILCALKLLTILAIILVASFMSWIVSTAEILLSLDDLIADLCLWILKIRCIMPQLTLLWKIRIVLSKDIFMH